MKKVLCLTVVMLMLATTAVFANPDVAPDTSTGTSITISGTAPTGANAPGDIAVMVFKLEDGPGTGTVAEKYAPGGVLNATDLRTNLRYIDQLTPNATTGVYGTTFNFPANFPNGSYVLVAGNTEKDADALVIPFAYGGGIKVDSSDDNGIIGASTTKVTYYPVRLGATQGETEAPRATAWGTDTYEMGSINASGAMLMIPANAPAGSVKVTGTYKRWLDASTTKDETVDKNISVVGPASVSNAVAEPDAGNAKVYNLSVDRDADTTAVKFVVAVNGNNVEINNAYNVSNNEVTATWDTSNLPSGSYTIKASATNVESQDAEQAFVNFDPIAVSNDAADVISLVFDGDLTFGSWTSAGGVDVTMNLTPDNAPNNAFGQVSAKYRDDAFIPAADSAVAEDDNADNAITVNVPATIAGRYTFTAKAGFAADSFIAVKVVNKDLVRDNAVVTPEAGLAIAHDSGAPAATATATGMTDVTDYEYAFVLRSGADNGPVKESSGYQKSPSFKFSNVQTDDYIIIMWRTVAGAKTTRLGRIYP